MFSRNSKYTRRPECQKCNSSLQDAEVAADPFGPLPPGWKRVADPPLIEKGVPVGLQIASRYEEQTRVRRERVGFMWASPRWYDTSIHESRYGGVYEDCLWYAIRCEPEWLDDDHGCDVECPSWWSDYWDAPIGRGNTPNDALADLERILKLGREAFAAERKKRNFEKEESRLGP